MAYLGYIYINHQSTRYHASATNTAEKLQHTECLALATQECRQVGPWIQLHESTSTRIDICFQDTEVGNGVGASSSSNVVDSALDEQAKGFT